MNISIIMAYPFKGVPFRAGTPATAAVIAINIPDADIGRPPPTATHSARAIAPRPFALLR
jgi:hypothetical protein